MLAGTPRIAEAGGETLGTVTSVSVVSANGFAGTVANASTTPAITLSTTINSAVLVGNGTAISAATTTGTGSTVVLNTSPTLVTPTLGAATATSINGLTITSSTGTLTITNAKTLSSTNTLTLTGTDGTTINVGAATSGKILIGDGTNMVLSTPTYPNVIGSLGQYLQSDGTNATWGSGVGQASITSPTSAISNVSETIIVQTGTLAAARLQLGTIIRIVLIGTCSSGTALSGATFTIHIGTAGSILDAAPSVVNTSLMSGAGSNIPFRAVWECVVTATGLSAKLTSCLTVFNSSAVNGISTNQVQIIQAGTIPTFNSNTANIISASALTGALSNTLTFQSAFMEIVYK